ncbi:MAG: hypothetical protein ABIZ95_21500 [Pyrinomonadaceae bacterium]
MNITFHTLAAVSTAVLLSPARKADRPVELTSPSELYRLSAGFALGILLHGVLDFLPHSYPIHSILDVLLGTLLFATVWIVAARSNRPLLTACFVGAIAPDLIDHTTSILNRRLGWSLPVKKIFPWHWPEYSGSIYDGSYATESLVLHLVVTFVSLGLLYFCRQSFLGFAKA